MNFVQLHSHRIVIMIIIIIIINCSYLVKIAIDCLFFCLPNYAINTQLDNGVHSDFVNGVNFQRIILFFFLLLLRIKIKIKQVLEEEKKTLSQICDLTIIASHTIRKWAIKCVDKRWKKYINAGWDSQLWFAFVYLKSISNFSK